MDNYLLRCPKCGKIYKCTKQNNKYITDFGDDVTNKCISCNTAMNPIIILTTDWIAELLFKVKGN